jgi:hypothetical protein
MIELIHLLSQSIQDNIDPTSNCAEQLLSDYHYQAYWKEKTVVAAINMVDPPIVLQVDDNKDEAQ